MDRRQFLCASALAAASLGLGGCSVENKWDFTEIDYLDYSLFRSDTKHCLGLMQKYVPMGNIKTIQNGPIKKSFIDSIPQELLIELGEIGPEDVEITEMDYAVPGNLRTSEHAIDFFEHAIEFLYGKVKGLDQHDIKWTIPQLGDNYSKDYDSRGFVPHSVYHISRYRAKKGDTVFQTYLARYVTNPSCSIVMDGNDIENFYLCIPTNYLALVGIFAETIPLTTNKATIVYSQEADKTTALEADETLSEAMSHILAKEIADKLEIPGGVSTIYNAFKSLRSNPKYRFVPRAVEWMEKNSIQRGFDIYMQEGPRKFMETIGVSDCSASP